MKFKIGDLARMTGCKVVTIRYYEKEGLLDHPERTGNNYRLYDENDAARLRFILHCRQHGMSLAEIGDLLRFRDHPTAECGWINTLVDQHIASVEKRIESLVQLKEYLSDLRHRCDGGKGSECGILRSLAMSEHCAHCQRLAEKNNEEEKKLSPSR